MKATPFPETKEEAAGELVLSHVSFSYPGGGTIYRDVSLQAEPGEIIGVTGPVACGKSTFGKTFLCEYPYEGSITFGGRELAGTVRMESAAAALDILGMIRSCLMIR